MNDKIKNKLIKDYKDNKISYTNSISAKENRRNWLKEIMKEWKADHKLTTDTKS